MNTGKRLITLFDSAFHAPGTHGFVGMCGICANVRAVFQLRFVRRGRYVWQPLCRMHAERVTKKYGLVLPPIPGEPLK